MEFLSDARIVVHVNCPGS